MINLVYIVSVVRVWINIIIIMVLAKEKKDVVVMRYVGIEGRPGGGSGQYKSPAIWLFGYLVVKLTRMYTVVNFMSFWPHNSG